MRKHAILLARRRIACATKTFARRDEAMWGRFPTAQLARFVGQAIRLLAVIAFFAFTAILAQTTRSVWDGVYSADQSKRGQELYARECASCHGSDLGGGESAPPLAGAGFLSNWTGLTVGELFERTRVSMPQNDPGKLSRQQNSDILAYMLSMNRFPAGKVELDKDTTVLKQIRLDAEKK